MSNAHEFEVGSLRFTLDPLDLDAQLEGLALVTGAMLPAFVAIGAGMKTTDVADALHGLDKLPKLVSLFMAKAKVDWQGNGFVALKDFKNLVFSRRPDLLLGFVAECVWVEYSAFLSDDGKAILEKAGNRFDFLTA